MKILYELRAVRSFFPALCALGVLSVGLSCGKSSDEGSQASATPTPIPTVTEQPESAPVAFWLTRDAGAGPIAVRFDSAGRQSLQIDLVNSGVDYGPITALHFLDAATLLYFVNGGSGKEMLGTIDIKTGIVKNRAWGSESSIRDKFKDKSVGTLLSGFQSGVLHAQIQTGIRTIRYNQEGGLSAQDYTLPDGCLTGSLSGIFLVQGGGKNRIIALTFGTQAQLLAIMEEGGTKTCTPFDYGSGETTADHKPVNLVQMPDGKVYVLYQHNVADESKRSPKIVRYDFDGSKLSNPKTIFSSKDVLSATPLGMIARTNKKLLVANPLENSLLEIAIKGDSGSQTDFYQKTSYANGLTALVAEPP
jgi:hypothetical protein